MKKVFIFLVVFISFIAKGDLFAQSVDVPKLYMFIVYQKEQNLISKKDMWSMRSLAGTIENASKDKFKVVIKILGSDEMTKNKIISELNLIKINSNDVIWYYYSGKGADYTTLPKTYQHEVPITWVYEQIKAKQPRLSITQYECSNWISSEEQAVVPDITYLDTSFLRFLILRRKGHIIVSSCSKGKFAYGQNLTGSIFTHTLCSEIHKRSNKTWKGIFEKTKSLVEEWAAKNGTTQIPLFNCEGCQFVEEE